MYLVTLFVLLAAQSATSPTLDSTLDAKRRILHAIKPNPIDVFRQTSPHELADILELTPTLENGFGHRLLNSRRELQQCAAVAPGPVGNEIDPDRSEIIEKRARIVLDFPSYCYNVTIDIFESKENGIEHNLGYSFNTPNGWNLDDDFQYPVCDQSLEKEFSYSDLKNVGLKVNEDNIAEFWFDFFWDEDVTDDFFGNFTRRREVDVPFKLRLPESYTIPVAFNPDISLQYRPSTSPSKGPSLSPSNEPTFEPSEKAPTFEPTTEPTRCPSTAPSTSPTPFPSKFPTDAPTNFPTSAPTNEPSIEPTEKFPTMEPTCEPTERAPTLEPTTEPTRMPSEFPSLSPTSTYPSTVPTSTAPSVNPTTTQPSTSPSSTPTSEPSFEPTEKEPTFEPTSEPTRCPSDGPSTSPSNVPSTSPSTSLPTTGPSDFPSFAPTTSGPSTSPTTTAPSTSPTSAPTDDPTIEPSEPFPTLEPTMEPTIKLPTFEPTSEPTRCPSEAPTVSPSDVPSTAPSNYPSKAPTPPTFAPTEEPTCEPSKAPTTTAPTTSPSSAPSEEPTLEPSEIQPTFEPTTEPTRMPSDAPSFAPSVAPSPFPSKEPTDAPTDRPTSEPSLEPTEKLPTLEPTCEPTMRAPTFEPTTEPTLCPTAGQPTSMPSSFPSESPSISVPTTGPSAAPSTAPSKFPTDPPSADPTFEPTLEIPTFEPTTEPTRCPSDGPSTSPSSAPSTEPTFQPSMMPTVNLTAMYVIRSTAQENIKGDTPWIEIELTTASNWEWTLTADYLSGSEEDYSSTINFTQTGEDWTCNQPGSVIDGWLCQTWLVKFYTSTQCVRGNRNIFVHFDAIVGGHSKDLPIRLTVGGSAAFACAKDLGAFELTEEIRYRTESSSWEDVPPVMFLQEKSYFEVGLHSGANITSIELTGMQIYASVVSEDPNYVCQDCQNSGYYSLESHADDQSESFVFHTFSYIFTGESGVNNLPGEGFMQGPEYVMELTYDVTYLSGDYETRRMLLEFDPRRGLAEAMPERIPFSFPLSVHFADPIRDVIETIIDEIKIQPEEYIEYEVRFNYNCAMVAAPEEEAMFLEECSRLMFPTECRSLRCGSIIVKMASPTIVDRDAMVRTLAYTGMMLPSFGEATVLELEPEVEEAPQTEYTTHAASSALIYGSIALIVISIAACVIVHKKRQQNFATIE